MPQNMLVAQGFLPENSVKLARFLVDVAEPHVSWHDPKVDITSTDALVRDHLGYSETQQVGSDKSFAATLTSLVSASCSKRINASTKVSSAKVKTYQLQNSNSWFRKCVKEQETRAWIVEQSDDGWSDLYFVVGYHTMLDASVVLGANDTAGVSGNVAVPVSTALAASGIVLPAGGMLDPKVSATHQEHRGGQVQFVAPGERVCALQYRKVVFKWFSSRDIDKATLEKENRWRTVDTLRNLRDSDMSANDDVLEVDLQDDDVGDASGADSIVIDGEGEFIYGPAKTG